MAYFILLDVVDLYHKIGKSDPPGTAKMYTSFAKVGTVIPTLVIFIYIQCIIDCLQIG